MTPKSVTVFVGRERGLFIARTHAADAIHLTSATLAARKCGARHLGVSEDQIEVFPDSENVLIACVKEPAKAFAWALLASCIGLGAAALGVWLMIGGAS